MVECQPHPFLAILGARDYCVPAMAQPGIEQLGQYCIFGAAEG